MAREKVRKGLEEAKKLERHLEEITERTLSQETMEHVVKAGLELVQAADVTMRKMNVPDEAKARIHRAEKEVLLAMRSFIDVVLQEIDKEIPAKKADLKKINIKRKPK